MPMRNLPYIFFIEGPSPSCSSSPFFSSPSREEAHIKTRKIYNRDETHKLDAMIMQRASEGSIYLNYPISFALNTEYA
jgi:hypothetical protein